MNGEEAAGLGATYYAAFLAGMRIRSFNLLDAVPYAINTSIQGEATPRSLFAQYTMLPAVVSVALQGQALSKNELTVAVTGKAGHSSRQYTASIGNVTDSWSRSVVSRKAFFRIDRNGLTTLDRVEDLSSHDVMKDAPLKAAPLSVAVVVDKSRATAGMIRSYRKERLRWDDQDKEAKIGLKMP